MYVDRNTKIAIIGGGIGGLGLLLSLQRIGFKNVHLFEKDFSFDSRRQGYGLTIQQASSALRKLELSETAKRLDVISSSHFMFAKDGHILGCFGRVLKDIGSTPKSYLPKQNQKQAQKKFCLHLPRQVLRRIIYDAIPDKSKIYWNASLDKIKSDKLEIQGVEHEFNLLVGCDGIYSKVRQLFDPSPLNYLGVVVVLGTLTMSSSSLCFERIWQTMDGSTRLFVMPFGNLINESCEIMWQLSFPIAEESKAQHLANPQSKFELKTLVLELCKNWHSPVEEMLQNTNWEKDVMATAVYDRDPLPHDKRICSHNITLVGDSLHPMSPFKGQGANQALLDAISLSDQLNRCSAKEITLSKALENYEREALSRSKSKVLDSRNRAVQFHSYEYVEPATDSKALREKRGIPEDFMNILSEAGIGAWDANRINQRVLEKQEEYISNKSIP